uniref:(northern house mosquito) hypothetical protein n=1 Tax=Culex pipiens TaxID=7175 RepID=A0A8D8EWN3_CULPI
MLLLRVPIRLLRCMTIILPLLTTVMTRRRRNSSVLTLNLLLTLTNNPLTTAVVCPIKSETTNPPKSGVTTISRRKRPLNPMRLIQPRPLQKLKTSVSVSYLVALL